MTRALFFAASFVSLALCGVAALHAQTGTQELTPGAPLPVSADCTTQDGGELPVPAVFAEAKRSEDVDVKPRLIRAGRQRAPDGWKGRRGDVRVEFVIDAAGAVVPCTMTVIHASHRAFIVPSLAMIRSSTFLPGQSGGLAVPVRVTQGVSFQSAR
jgi:hypothetical protein